MKEDFLPSNGITKYTSCSSINQEEVASLVIKRAKVLVNQLIEYRGHDNPPFLSEDYARLLSIKNIERTDLGEIDGLLIKSPDGYLIKVNSKHPKVRQNFSFAHEIGHTFLHELERQPCENNPEYRMPNIGIKFKERLCHTVATELLMPESVFKNYLSRVGVSVSSIAWLAQTFRASIPATAIRISEVSEEPCLALRWEIRQKANSKGFYLLWPKQILKSRYVKNSSLLKAYENDNIVKGFKSFEIGRNKRLYPMESKGFSQGNMRYIISLVFTERQKNQILKGNHA